MSVKKAKGYVAVLDIGSNAVRLVIYDGLDRAPFKIHNERNICSLGADLATTGRLNPEGVLKALDSIGRFAGLLAAMNITHIRAVATAALRDATDGPAFIAKVEKSFGLKIRVVDGDEEAMLSAQGVMMNGLGRDGVIGDYGGGSLELIAVEKGVVKDRASVPVGSHRLQALKLREARMGAVHAYLAGVPFLHKYAGRDFYALGGAWRSMARAHMRLVGHPLLVLDHYAIGAKKAAEFAHLLSRQSSASLERTVGFSKKRARDIGAAALVMECLFEKMHPRRLIFSGTGLREGLIYELLPPAVKRQDPLMSSCAKIALKISRFDNLKEFDALAGWIRPLFGRDAGKWKDLLAASCMLSDMGWFEHEDYQAAHAFERLLVMPYYGIDHAGRAFLALSQYARYAGGYLPEATRGAQRIAGEEGVKGALIAGLAQRMAYLLTGGALSLLRHSELTVAPKAIALKFKAGAHVLNAEVVGDALADLAKVMEKRAEIRTG